MYPNTFAHSTPVSCLVKPFVFRECLNHSRKRRGVARVLALPQLACVVATHEQVNGSPQRVDAAREAAGAPPEPRQVVTQVGVRALDRVGLRLVVHRGVVTPPAQFPVRVEGVGVITRGVRRGINYGLH